MRLLNRPFRDGIENGTSSRGSVVRSPRRRRSGRESRRMTGQKSASARVPAANLVGSTDERCNVAEFSFRVAVHARFLRRLVLSLNLIERDRHWIKLGQNFGDEQIRSTGTHGSSESRDESLVSTFEFFCIRVKRDHAFARVDHGRAPGNLATHRGARLIRAPFTTHFRRLRGRATRFGHFSLSYTCIFFSRHSRNNNMSAIVIASGGFMVFIVIVLVAVYVFTRSKPKGSADNPYENDDPNEKVFVVDDATGARIEKRDCSGTSWIKKGECTRDGKVLDGTKEACGRGKVEWILDPSHKDFKPALGGGACASQLRDCENPCPKPCEGDTWIKGACVRVHADGKETKLDGTAGKCGDGVLRETLDQKADDFKPAVGSGGCTFRRSGACHVKCPKPQPPKCSYPVLGWQNNDMGCVVSQTNHTKLKCGQKGVIQQFKASTINTNKCDQLTRWAACTMPACPVDCRGTWGKNDGWGKCVGQCNSQPQKELRYNISRTAKHGGKACPYENNKLEYKNCGKIVPCCEKGQWSGWSACENFKKTRTRRVSNCASNVVSKETADCNVTTNGRCGPNHGKTRCKGKACCSQWGWCGGEQGKYSAWCSGTSKGNWNGKYDGR